MPRPCACRTCQTLVARGGGPGEFEEKGETPLFACARFRPDPHKPGFCWCGHPDRHHEGGGSWQKSIEDLARPAK